MALKKLDVERYQKKDDDFGGDYCFGVKVAGEKFVYLQTSQERKAQIQDWKNNFSSGYILLNEGIEKLVLFSIEGISTFNLNWRNFEIDWSSREDFHLTRQDKIYRELELFERVGKNQLLEKAFLDIINP